MELADIFQSIRPRYPELKDGVALVTGSSRGIGKGIALRLAREGMKVILHGVDETEVANTIDDFKALDVQAEGIATDFSTDAGVDDLFAFLTRHHTRLDVLVNNAASLRRVTFTEEHQQLLEHQLDVNIKAPYLCAWHAAQMMREQGAGNIINISSVGGLQAHWRGLPYDATKGAMDSMTRAMALDLAPQNIRVNAIGPGAIMLDRLRKPELKEKIKAVADRIPLGRYGMPLEIAATAAFLASEDASYITGQIFYVDGGITAQISPPGQPI